MFPHIIEKPQLLDIKPITKPKVHLKVNLSNQPFKLSKDVDYSSFDLLNSKARPHISLNTISVGEELRQPMIITAPSLDYLEPQTNFDQFKTIRQVDTKMKERHMSLPKLKPLRLRKERKDTTVESM